MRDVFFLELFEDRSGHDIPTHTFMTLDLTALHENTGHREHRNVGGFQTVPGGMNTLDLYDCLCWFIFLKIIRNKRLAITFQCFKYQIRIINLENHN